MTEATFISLEAGGYPGAPGWFLLFFSVFFPGRGNQKPRTGNWIRVRRDADEAFSSPFLSLSQESGLPSRLLVGRRSPPEFTLRFVVGFLSTRCSRRQRSWADLSPSSSSFSSSQGGVIFLQMWTLGTSLFQFKEVLYVLYRRL